MKHKKQIITSLVCSVLIVLFLLSLCVCVRAEARDYTAEDVMCLANMIYGEISAVSYDDSYTVDDQNLVMQEWARVAINHFDAGIADSAAELMRVEYGFYLWNPIYATEEYQNKAIAENAELYERCRVNAMIAANDHMVESVPSDVIYADTECHGTLYRVYTIDTGYYRSTVYLSRRAE